MGKDVPTLKSTPTHCWGNHPSGNVPTQKPKQNPSGTPLHRVEAQQSALEKSLMSFFPHTSINRTYIWDTPNFIQLIESHQVSSDCTLMAYECTSIYVQQQQQKWNSMNWSKQSMRLFHRRSAAPYLRKKSWKHTWSSYWKSYSQTASSHLTTKFTTKLWGPP